jgi:hypothetical protein
MLATYGIMQPLDLGEDEIRLGGNYGIRGSENKTARAAVIATVLPVDELEVRVELFEIACLNSGIKLPAGDADSVEFRNRYIRMMAGCDDESRPLSETALDDSDRQLTAGEFVRMHIAMMERRNAQHA